MIIIPNVNKENSCFDCPVWSLCWDNKPTEDICKDRCPIVEFEGVKLFDDAMPTIEAEPKRGHWEFIGGYGYQYRCSNCIMCAERKTLYCPSCGSQMNEVEE